MFSHIMIGANDVSASMIFYDAALGALGIPPGRADDKGRVFYRTKTGVFGLTKPIPGRRHAPPMAARSASRPKALRPQMPGMQRVSPMADPRARIHRAFAKAAR